tara:strand:+ start:636 stop:926 length:291 start_codon:yes stop_codon:yes gene_type:complete
MQSVEGYCIYRNDRLIINLKPDYFTMEDVNIESTGGSAIVTDSRFYHFAMLDSAITRGVAQFGRFDTFPSKYLQIENCDFDGAQTRMIGLGIFNVS